MGVRAVWSAFFGKNGYRRASACGGLFFLALASGAAGAPPVDQGAVSADGTVITLTQTGCQFIEAEGGIDHGYTATKKADCIGINTKTGEERIQKGGPLTLKPGKYIFRVTNRDVPYELGFWLRGVGLARFVQPNVSGGGLTQGVTRDYAVELTAGEYLYSCPLNPTPDYPLIVKE